MSVFAQKFISFFNIAMNFNLVSTSDEHFQVNTHFTNKKPLSMNTEPIFTLPLQIQNKAFHKQLTYYPLLKSLCSLFSRYSLSKSWL